MIITISRELGAGGGEIARRVAAALGWRVVDNELVDQIAARTGLSPAEVRDREERAPGFLERLIRMLTKAAPEMLTPAAERVPELEEANLVKITEAVVEEIALEGRVVLVGRAAPAVLSRDRDAIHVKIVAPQPARIEALMTRLGIGRDHATADVESSDANRKRYHEQYYERDWNDASQYHMVLNSVALGLDHSVATIVGRAKTLWPAETLERRASQP